MPVYINEIIAEVDSGNESSSTSTINQPTSTDGTKLITQAISEHQQLLISRQQRLLAD